MTEPSIIAPKRCGIYTRKSTNSRLEHEVNSLTTQHEICSAYISSQRYRGWMALPRRYDDGGHSGSGIERPALAALMHDIEAGEIDTVVVYKIDRLTRSLADFVRLVEIFDRRGIGLVSVSQAFDTSDSMGRMILNVLLTFSQFERELIAERVRDSIRTRKRHGRMHGGLAPFGYEYRGGELEIVEAEAEIVRFIYEAFLRLGTFTAAMTAVREAGFCTSLKSLRNGSVRGGRPMSAGSVYNILQNPIYVGEIRGHDRTWPGRHKPIIDRTTWDATSLLAKARKRKGPASLGTDHFLAGLLWDDLGRHMLLDANWIDGKPYHFYISSNAQWSQAEYRRAYRTRADRLDAVVLASAEAFLADRGELRTALKTHGLFGDDLDRHAMWGKRASERLAGVPAEQRSQLFFALLEGVEISAGAVTLHVRLIELVRFLEWEGQGAFVGRPADWPTSKARHAIKVPVSVISPERWPVFTVQPCEPSSRRKPNKQLTLLLRSARAAQQFMEKNRDLELAGLAKGFGRSPGYFSRLIRLNYLAPDILTAIADGTQPPGLDRSTLASAHIPLDWAVQRRMFGFPEPRRPVSPRNLFGRGMWPTSDG
ncbi:recombinase family protein [Blastomonas fulva]|uniref:recombinase family protein n=1 Tax=Blastomonas fulva TaxID=1550728 RepID=UPI003F71CED6